jgi:hypothetical protein
MDFHATAIKTMNKVIPWIIALCLSAHIAAAGPILNGWPASDWFGTNIMSQTNAAGVISALGLNNGTNSLPVGEASSMAWNSGGIFSYINWTFGPSDGNAVPDTWLKSSTSNSLKITQFSPEGNIIMDVGGQLYAQGGIAGPTPINGQIVYPNRNFIGNTFPMDSQSWTAITGAEVDLQNYDTTVSGYENIGKLTVNAFGANVIVTNPGTWFTTDGLWVRGVTNGDSCILTLHVTPGNSPLLDVRYYQHHP